LGNKDMGFIGGDNGCNDVLAALSTCFGNSQSMWYDSGTWMADSLVEIIKMEHVWKKRVDIDGVQQWEFFPIAKTVASPLPPMAS